MCGLVAVLQPHEGLPVALLERMRDRLLHRGPDEGQCRVIRESGGTVSLAHRRLSILDLRSVSNQPFESGSRRKVMVFNGEIYNFVEIRVELSSLGYSFTTDSDTEVLLAAYEHWGEACVQHLNGMFAFVIWDRDLNKAFVARDRFGEKPLFYARLANGGIAFASEIKALTAFSEVECSADINQVDKALNGVVIQSQEKTMFRGVRRFMPAHSAWIDLSGDFYDYRRYWTPDYDGCEESDVPFPELVDQFGELLKRSVNLRSRSDVRGAACLSGGLDSSALVGLLCNSDDKRGFRLKETISARFPNDPTIDEGEYIDMVLKSTSLKGAALEVSPSGLLQNVRRLHWHHEENIPSTSMYLEWCVMERAKELGYKVMIDGQGADELLGGYQYFFQYLQMDQYTNLEYKDLFLNTYLYKFRLWLASLKYENHERRISINPGMSLQQLRDRKLPLGDEYKYPDAPGLPPLSLGGDFKYALSSSLLYDSLPVQLQSGDRNSMAHGVETRFPFLDYKLVDWCIKLPSKALIHNGWQKHILRKSLKGVIPNKVRYRSDKVGYMGPQDTWLRGELSEWVEERIMDPILQDIPSYDRSLLCANWNAHKQGGVDHSTYLWQWASMAEWLSMHKTGVWRNGF